MQAVADAIVGAATSEETRRERPAVAAFVRELITRQDPHGLCRALRGARRRDRRRPRQDRSAGPADHR